MDEKVIMRGISKKWKNTPLSIKEYKKEYKIPSKVDFQVLGDIAEWILSH